jgi:hypothetical protein
MGRKSICFCNETEFKASEVRKVATTACGISTWRFRVNLSTVYLLHAVPLSLWFFRYIEETPLSVRHLLVILHNTCYRYIMN